MDLLVQVGRPQRVFERPDLADFLGVSLREDDGRAARFSLGDGGGIVGPVIERLGAVARA
ncbi:hypothetical protein D3C78_1860220 [compost metagenome]